MSGDTASVVGKESTITVITVRNFGLFFLDAENGIDLCDRVLLACRFMENEMLMEVTDQLAFILLGAHSLCVVPR